MESCSETVRDVQKPSEGSGSAQGTTPPKKFNLKHLINKINYIHFLDGKITACFQHKRYATSLPILVKPQPCTDANLVCTWENTSTLQAKLKTHTFQHLLVNDGQKALLVEPIEIEISNDYLRFTLPNECKELNSRQIRRHPSTNISAELIQNGSSFKGILIEFSATALHIRINATPPQTFQWLNPESPATLRLSRQEETLYTTECSIFKQTCEQSTRSLVLTPNNDRILKFKPKKYRSTRQQLRPSPTINFKHPLTNKWINLSILDISGSGFSVTENTYDSKLLPGLIIPDLTLAFANSDSITCKAQVVYRIEPDNSESTETVKCGIAFLDMSLEQQTRLLGIIYQAENKRAFLNNKVDLDELWKFFFDTGFIYPEKYAHFTSHKNEFKKTYEALYGNNPNIARHFIYQDNGTIQSHMSMVRFYSKSWLVQHHASRKNETIKGGISVLSNASRYANETYNLYSAHLNFLFCYFRENNRFPKRVFGGAVKYMNNPKGCSIDSFAYLHFKKSFGESWKISNNLTFSRSDNDDLQELKRFIDFSSGGLMVPTLDLDLSCHNDSPLFNEYRNIGMRREQHLFSIKINGYLKAVVVVNLSELFLNMSDLTNCFKIIVIDPDRLTRETLFLMLSMLCVKFEIDEVPALIYPKNFAEKINVPIEKIYNLWILNMQHMDAYFDFCNKIIPNFSLSPSAI